MSEVWFYLLADATQATRQQFICRFGEMVIKRHRQALIYCDSDAQAETLDDLLWTHTSPTSFVAHSVNFACPAPIQLVTTSFPSQGDILLNLTDELLTVTGYQRIVEIINPESRDASRSRWRHYQQQGLTPELKPIA
ncbi:MAG: DNA polymerase III subunit chi [Gammaproteobacteria bacterium]|nr:DNA polymerase III subunit chi [Gammaproteobacteria bacterium]